MAKRFISGFILFIVFSTVVRAEDIQINPKHPDQYTVLKGDTLWDISSKFLNNPWQWTEVWKNNRQISNPNLIYPGDTIYFSVVNGKAQLSLAKEEPVFASPSDGTCVLKSDNPNEMRTEFKTSEDGKLLPCIRERSIKDAISLIPTDAIAKYLNSPRVVDENELSHAPYVIDFAGEHLLAGIGDKVYVRGITPGQNGSYTVYRTGETYKSPENGQVLGYEASYVADTLLEQSGDPATLTIAKSNSEIRIGDRLMPTAESSFALNYFPKPPEEKIQGSIISVLGGVSQIGQYNVVVLDKGNKDGLQIGHELDIYKRGKIARDPYTANKNETVKLPDEKAGKLMVFRVFDRISYALVMKASQAIHILDKAQTP